MTVAEKLEGLSLFVGTWHTTGVTRATAEKPSEPVDATDRYEWMEGGFFLLHHIESRTPEVFKALEIIGRERQGEGCSMTSFDSKGRVVTSTMELKGRDVRVSSKTARFAGAFSGVGASLNGTWEMSEDGLSWRPSMDITLKKV